LPAVSYVKPSAFVDELILFEGLVKKIVDAVQANPKLGADDFAGWVAQRPQHDFIVPALQGRVAELMRIRSL
jgi:hypothetical protein